MAIYSGFTQLENGDFPVRYVSLPDIMRDFNIASLKQL